MLFVGLFITYVIIFHISGIDIMRERAYNERGLRVEQSSYWVVSGAVGVGYNYYTRWTQPVYLIIRSFSGE